MKTNMDHWDFVLQNLPESYKEWFSKETDYLQKNVTPNSSVLEIGCGDGRSIYDILPITQNITGIDYDDFAIGKARYNFNKYPSIKIIKGNAVTLDFPDNTFDFVICMTTFANFGENLQLILSEMKKVLKSTGKIIISVFSEDALSERMKVYEALKVDIVDISGGKVTFSKELVANTSEQFSQAELEKIFFLADLQIDDITRLDIAYLCTLSK